MCDYDLMFIIYSTWQHQTFYFTCLAAVAQIFDKQGLFQLTSIESIESIYSLAMMMSMMPMMLPMMVFNAVTGDSDPAVGRTKRKRSNDNNTLPTTDTFEEPVRRSRLTFANVRARSSAIDLDDPAHTAEDDQVDQAEIDLDYQLSQAMQVDINDLLPFSAFGRSVVVVKGNSRCKKKLAFLGGPWANDFGHGISLLAAWWPFN